MYNQKYHRFQQFYNHKFGFHINGPNQAAYEAAIRLKPRIIKTLEHNVDAMRTIREAAPDAFFIGRLFDPDQNFGNQPGSDPMSERIRRARRRGVSFAEKILRLEVNQVHYQGRPIFNAWESFNEIFPESVDADSQKVYDEFQVAFGQKMLAAGFEPVAMNFATGNFRGWHFVDNFAGTLETHKYLGFHEYDWPRLDRLHNIGLNAEESARNIQDRVPEVGSNRGNDGMWLCLRYRRIMHEGVRQKYGDKHVCIITECGMTQGVQQGEDVGPWFKANTLPRSYPDAAVPSPIDEEVYWQQLLWYNSELMQDDYLMGACLFVTGAVAQWWSFEHLGTITNRLARFQREIDLAVNPPEQRGDKRPADPPGVASDKDPASDATDVTDAIPVEIDAGSPEEAPGSTMIPTPVESKPPVSQGDFVLETGAGLPLLVGDIGIGGESITITRPNGAREQLTSGSKAEHGSGGFELYAAEPGVYRLEFMDQNYELRLDGRFTRVRFKRKVDVGQVVGHISFRDDRRTYAVGEKVFLRMEVANNGSEPVSFSILGLLTSTGRFQTSWENGAIQPGDAFRHEDGLAFAKAGIYGLQLSICFESRRVCLESDKGWRRFEPGLEVVIGEASSD